MGKRPDHLVFVQAFEGAYAPTEEAPLTIPRCKILGMESRWGRRFTPAALIDAASRGIYEGLTIYEDHPEIDFDDPDWRKKSLPPRGVAEALGFVRNVTYVEGKGLFGDVTFTVDSQLTRSVCKSAVLNPKQYGFSHHADYSSKFEGNIEIVERITDAYSVDLVTRPATTNGLFEGGNPVADKPKKTIRQALEAVCTLGIAKKIVKGLEGEFLDAPMPETAVPTEGDVSAEVSVEDQMAAAFSAAIAAVAADTGMDVKTKLAKLKEILTAQEKLSGGGDAAPATEGDAVVADEEETEEEEKMESAPTKGIGYMEAFKLYEKSKMKPTHTALEAVALMPANVAEAHVAEAVAKDNEIAELKERLKLTTDTKPRSVGRGSLEGGAVPGVTRTEKTVTQNAEKPWLRLSAN